MLPILLVKMHTGIELKIGYSPFCACANFVFIFCFDLYINCVHHLLSLKLHSSSFSIIPVSLNGSRRVRVNQESDGDVCTDNSLLDVYANRERYDSSSDVRSMNFVKFATTFKVVNAKLTKLPPDVIPCIFPTFSSSPKGANFPAYCKNQLLRYKPWKLTPNNAWDDQEPSDEVLVRCWHDFLQTPYAQNNVPDWFDKLQNVLQNQEGNNEDQVVSETNAREEWMIISDLHTPFENNDEHSSFYNWQQDRARYTEQQIGEMPAWIKNHKEQSNDINFQSHPIIEVGLFSEMQKLAHEIVKDTCSPVEKDPLCDWWSWYREKLSYKSQIRNLVQNKCAVTATTGKASYNIKGVTIHSLLKLPIGPRGNADLTGQNLCRLQENLNGIEYIIIDRYSMLGQTLFGWIDKRCKQVSGYYDKVLGGKSFILVGDPGQLPQ